MPNDYGQGNTTQGTTAAATPAREPRFVMATLTDGSHVISEFTRLGGLGGYASAVMTGRKAFNAWKITGREHPVNGEAVLVRQRRLINPRLIESIEEVRPTTQGHEYDAGNFEPVEHVQGGRNGRWIATADAAAEVPALAAGVAYPVHRDDATRERYVLVDRDGTRFYYERRPAPPRLMLAGDGDDDEG